MTLPSSRKALVARLLKALYLGAISLVLASMVGALVLSLFTIYARGMEYIGLVLPSLFYSLLIGPMIAWPVCLVVLPLLWLAIDDSWRGRQIVIPVVGAISGLACIHLLSDTAADLTYIDSAVLAAGSFGGAAAGLLFGSIRQKT